MMTDEQKTEQLTHWKSGSKKSPYLGAWDLPGFRNVQLTIKNVKKQMTAGLPDDSIQNIIFFNEPGIKPMLMNATNAKMLRALTGSPFIEKWVNIKIELRVEKDIKAFGAVHDGLRIVNKKLAAGRTKIVKGHPKLKELQEKYQSGTKLEVITKYYDVTEVLLKDGKSK